MLKNLDVAGSPKASTVIPGIKLASAMYCRMNLQMSADHPLQLMPAMTSSGMTGKSARGPVGFGMATTSGTSRTSGNCPIDIGAPVGVGMDEVASTGAGIAGTGAGIAGGPSTMPCPTDFMDQCMGCVGMAMKDDAEAACMYGMAAGCTYG